MAGTDGLLTTVGNAGSTGIVGVGCGASVAAVVAVAGAVAVLGGAVYRHW